MHRTPVVLVVVAVLLAGCAFLDSGQKGSAPTPPSLSPSPLPSEATGAGGVPGGLKKYYDQELSWKACDDSAGNRCATLQVPLDYADPSGAEISLAVLKVPTDDPAQRVGSLVVNPGGPGGSGVSYAASAPTFFGSELRQAFDIVGFDPRGVGQSDPVECATTAQIDALIAADPDPDTARERGEVDAQLRAFGKGCLRRSGDLPRHMSTEEAARDIDILRAALGDKKLAYFGASYGTFLGATYADLFPERVGRMVLDGAIDPSLSTVERSLVQARGFEVALRAYVQNCVDAGECYLGSSVEQGTRRIRQFLDDVEQRPLPGLENRMLEAGNAVYGIWMPLYRKDYWGLLDTSLEAAFAGDGSLLMTLADAYLSRTADGYADNAVEALLAVNCLDSSDAVPSAETVSYIPRFEKASPTFGAIFAYGLSNCYNWPVRTDKQPQPLDAKGAAPIVVIGTSRDPATPLVWAQALAKQLDSGVLITRDGDGHTGYRAGNSCVDDAVEAYLVSDDVPDRGVFC